MRSQRSVIGHRSIQELWVIYLYGSRLSTIVITSSLHHSHHTICLLPSQYMLDVHGRFRLHGESDQTQHQTDGSIAVLFPRRR